MNSATSSYYKTTSKDCDGNTIADKYLTGDEPAIFLDGQCCNINCDGFSMSVENTTAEDGYLKDKEGKIKVTVTGGVHAYTYAITGGPSGGSVLPSTASYVTDDKEYEFTGVGGLQAGEPPFKITVTDANGCAIDRYLLLTDENLSMADTKLGCTDSDAYNYDSTADQNAGCLYCSASGPRGEGYNAVSFGLTSSTASAMGVKLIKPDFIKPVAATKDSANGSVYFKGALHSSAVSKFSTDTDASFRLNLYKLGTEKRANDITDTEILAKSVTATSATLEHTFGSLTRGWYAISAIVENVPTLAACKSIYRFEVGYKGCTDKNAMNYNPIATEDDRSCKYEDWCGKLDSKCFDYKY